MKEGYFLIFSSMQTEECKMTYKKDCYVKYEAEARSEKIELCHTNYARECDPNALLRAGDEGAKEHCTTEHDTSKRKTQKLFFSNLP